MTSVLADRPVAALDVARRHRRGAPSWSTGRPTAGSAATSTATATPPPSPPRCVAHQVDLVAMAGFGTVLDRARPPRLPGPDPQHPPRPAARPSRAGTGCEDALAAGVTVTGCTVHVATLEMDAGPILAQQVVPCSPGDTVETLHERIKAVERRAVPGHDRRGRSSELAAGRPCDRRLRPRSAARMRREGAAVGLRQAGPGRAGPRAGRSGLGAGGQRQHLGRPGRGRHRPPPGGRGHRLARDARRPGQDPAPRHPRRDPGRPGRARATWPTSRPRASSPSTWWSATSTRSPPTPRSS